MIAPTADALVNDDSYHYRYIYRSEQLRSDLKGT